MFAAESSIGAPLELVGTGSEGVAQRIGILGGTFNPPHLAHVALARAAIEELGLERVLLVPAGVAPHKPAPPDPGAEHRLRMCLLAAGRDPRIEVSTIELDRPGPSYTVDTLRYIQATNPDAELTLILGADMARSLASWREPRKIVHLARLAVAGRDGPTPTPTPAEARSGTRVDVCAGMRVDVCAGGRADVCAAVHSVDESADPVFLGMEPLEVSSTQVRARVAGGEPIEQLVGPEVACYIAEQGLYR